MRRGSRLRLQEGRPAIKWLGYTTVYKQEITPKLMEKFQYKNVMQVPKVDKVIINIGVGEAIQNPKALDGAVNDLTVYYRTEADYYQGQEIHRRIQTAGRHAHWLQGYLAGRAYV